jgi:hypothetical protein
MSLGGHAYIMLLLTFALALQALYNYAPTPSVSQEGWRWKPIRNRHHFNNKEVKWVYKTPVPTIFISELRFYIQFIYLMD